MNWTTLNVIVGALVPLLIEFVANKLTGVKKFIVAVVITFLVSIVAIGAEGKLNFTNFDAILETFIVILTASQVFWRATWKHLFKE